MKYLFSVLALSLASYVQAQEPSQNIFKTEWQQIASDIDNWTDGIGMPIDEGIKVAVIALNAAHITTCASCEGHLDWGYAYPWIDVSCETEEIVQLAEKLYAMRAKLEEIFQVLRQNIDISEEQTQFLDEYHSVRKNLEKARQNAIEPLQELLIAFYKERSMSYEQMLIISHEILNQPRLQCVGSFSQTLRTTEQKESALKAYRAEMEALANFIRQKGFENQLFNK